MAQLPVAFRPDPQGWKKPWHQGPTYTVCFGFGVTHDQLVEYAIRVGIVSSSRSALRVTPAALYATKHIAKIAEVDLDMRSIYHPTYQYCLRLYNNYTQHFKELVEEDEKDVLDTIREELKIPEEEVPMWYFQMNDNVY